MKSSVNYKLSVDLNLPRNAHNQDLGNFMVRLAVTPNIHEFVKVHHHSRLLEQPLISSSPKQQFFGKAGLHSRFPLTHFPETYIMDLPQLYIRGPPHLHAQHHKDSKCTCKNCNCDAHKSKDSTSSDEQVLFQGHPLHRVNTGCKCAHKKGSEKISVMSTRPVILSYKPVFLEYLEMLFWSPFYATGFFRSGFSETINVDMVENWSKKTALLGTSANQPSYSSLSQLFITSDPLSSFVGSVASATNSLLTTAKHAFGKFKQSEDLNAELPNQEYMDKFAESSAKEERKSTGETPPKPEIYENIFDLSDDFLSNPDGNVWAVVELDRIAYLNNAKLTLHTQWSGLRFWMHKYRIVLFFIGPFFIWILECAAAVIAGYVVVSLFTVSEKPEQTYPSSRFNSRSSRTESSSLSNSRSLSSNNPSKINPGLEPERKSTTVKQTSDSQKTEKTEKSSAKSKQPQPLDFKGKNKTIVSNLLGNELPKDQSSPISESNTESEAEASNTNHSSHAPKKEKEEENKKVEQQVSKLDKPTTDLENDKADNHKPQTSSITTRTDEEDDSTDTGSILEESMSSLLSHGNVSPASVTHAVACGSTSHNDDHSKSRSTSISSLRRNNTSGGSSITSLKNKGSHSSISASSAKSVTGAKSSTTNSSASPSSSTIPVIIKRDFYPASRDRVSSQPSGASVDLHPHHTTMEHEARNVSNTSFSSTNSSLDNSNNSIVDEDSDSLQGQTAVASGGLGHQELKNSLHR